MEQSKSDEQDASQLPVVFLVGAGRSGTTWLQSLLAQHPAIASAPETDLFAGYFALLDRRWQFEAERRQNLGTRTGLMDLIDRSELDRFLGQLASRVLGAVLQRKPVRGWCSKKRRTTSVTCR